MRMKKSVKVIDLSPRASVIITEEGAANGSVVRGTKAIPKHFSIEDVINEFNDNPKALVDYVKTGLLKDVSILGVHLTQLAGMVGTPLLFEGKTYEKLPDGSWVEPKRFGNIYHVLNAVDTVFPNYQ